MTVEAVDLRDLISFAEDFDLQAPDALLQLANFAQCIMTNVGALDLVRRVRSLDESVDSITSFERTALEFIREPTYQGAIDVLVAIGALGGVRTHRVAIFRTCVKALQACQGNPELSPLEAAIQMREQNRLVGRPLPKRAVGSTLLLKGLEAETAVILDADRLDARNLYVAMTRASKRLIVCASSPILGA